jgi:hypothetical protein
MIDAYFGEKSMTRIVLDLISEGHCVLVKMTKKTFNFQGLSDINEGTWEKLLAKRTVVAMNNPDRYMRIDQGNCRIEFLSMISEAESIEKYKILLASSVRFSRVEFG